MSTIVITQLRNLLLFAMVLRAHSQTLRGRGSDCLIHDFLGNYLLLNRCFDLFLLLITALARNIILLWSCSLAHVLPFWLTNIPISVCSSSPVDVLQLPPLTFFPIWQILFVCRILVLLMLHHCAGTLCYLISCQAFESLQCSIERATHDFAINLRVKRAHCRIQSTYTGLVHLVPSLRGVLPTSMSVKGCGDCLICSSKSVKIR
jgi:hypothetical protein